jgi:serine/threonine protein kinase
MLTSPVDIQEGNFMLSLNDHGVLDDAINEAWEAGIPHKVDGGREVYLSTDFELPDDPGVPIISDFGDAQFGDAPFVGEVMPDLYRAPEIILGIPWDEKIDIWAFGLMVIEISLPIAFLSWVL